MEMTSPPAVLLVDGDDGGRYAHARVLRQAGFVVREARSAEAALASLLEVRPDLLILDINLPGLSGHEVLQRVKSHPRAAPIPLLFLSATYAEENSNVSGLEEGADAHLTKPVPARVLVATAAALARAGRLQRELAEARAELDRQRALLQTILETLPVPVLLAHDPHCRVITANRAGLEAFGSRGNLSASAPPGGGPAHRFFSGGRELAPHELPMQVALSEGRTVRDTELEAVLEDGRRVHVLISAAPLHDDRGQVTGGVATAFDLTQRKLLEEADRLQAQQARLLETILENVPVLTAYLDRDLRFVALNQRYAEVACFRPAELVGRSYAEAFPANADIAESLRQVLHTGRTVVLREVGRVPSRNPKLGLRYWDMILTPVLGILPPVLGGEKAVEGVVMFVEDVTERVTQRDRLLHAERARAEIAENLNDEISHRVKNNLAMVSGLLQMQALGQRNREVSSALQEAVARVRTFASLHEHMYREHAEEVDLFAILERVAGSTREVFMGRRDIDLTVTGSPVICAPRAATNLAVIANELITNALKHGQAVSEGGPRIAIELRPHQGGVRLAVWNSGNPVPASFDARAQQGMGLRLVWDLVVDQYGGQFTMRPHRDGTLAEVLLGGEMLGQ